MNERTGDSVTRYGEAFDWKIERRTVIVEGTTDVDLLQLARKLEKKATGEELFANGLTFIAAGKGDKGGARGVVRELLGLRCVGRTSLLADGRTKYRFMGLFDNDEAGRRAINLARSIDRSILEYRDVFRLRPVMAREGNPDPRTLEKTFREKNGPYGSLDWELEDLVSPDFVAVFSQEFSAAVIRTVERGGRVHREYSADVLAVIDLIRAVRFYFGLPTGREVARRR